MTNCGPIGLICCGRGSGATRVPAADMHVQVRREGTWQGRGEVSNREMQL